MGIDPAPLCIFERSVPSGDVVLHVGLAPSWYSGVFPGDAQGVVVVDGHTPLKMLAQEKPIRPQAHTAHRPSLVVLVAVLFGAAIGEAKIKFIEGQFQMCGAQFGAAGAQTVAPVFVHPFEVHGVDGVFLALKPVAGHFRDDHLAKAIGPRKGLPVGQQRHRLRPHIRPQNAALGLHRVGLDADAIFGLALGINRVFIGLRNAAPCFIKVPPVVIAAQAFGLDHAITQVGAAVGALPIHQAIGAAQIFVQHQVFTQQTNRLGGLVVKL